MQNLNILLEGQWLLRVDSFKHIGLILDVNVNFLDQIETCKKICVPVSILKTLADYFKLDLLLTVYHALVISYIQCCISI